MSVRRALALLIIGLLARDRRARGMVLSSSQAEVTHLHRFAVKGLDRDVLQSVTLQPGDAFPLDRRWALIRADRTHQFDPDAPSWIHKQEFLCAFTRNELLASFETSVRDDTSELVVRSRDSSTELLRARLDDIDGGGCARVEAFFSHAAGEPVALVRASDGTPRPHQFGNTGSGLSASGDVRTIHLVNARTVDALAAAAGVALDPGRFRANVILDGLEPWAEFSWVGRHFQLGSARLNCIKRTVRCAGVNVDARTGSGRADLDIPALLTRHFPQHGPYLGVYAQVVSAGEVRIGDRARVESATEGTPYGG